MSGSGARIFAEQLELVDRERRLAAARLRRVPADADDVAEVDVDLRSGEQLDPAAAVDEVEEDDLPHLAPRHHAAREPERAVDSSVRPASSCSRLGADRAISSRSGNRFGNIALRKPTRP